jgi:hypothetical protein
MGPTPNTQWAAYTASVESISVGGWPRTVAEVQALIVGGSCSVSGMRLYRLLLTPITARRWRRSTAGVGLIAGIALDVEDGTNAAITDLKETTHVIKRVLEFNLAGYATVQV